MTMAIRYQSAAFVYDYDIYRQVDKISSAKLGAVAKVSASALIPVRGKFLYQLQIWSLRFSAVYNSRYFYIS